MGDSTPRTKKFIIGSLPLATPNGGDFVVGQKGDTGQAVRFPTSALGSGEGGSGSPGLSAYQVAVQAGFQGTREQWLASLVGSPGTNGTNGTTPTSQQLTALITPLIPAPIPGHSPTTQELTALMAPLIPAPIAGQNGTNGTNGVDGAAWRNGVGSPANNLGFNGDYYLNTTNGDVHQRQAGTYAIVGNIKGPAGTNGTNGTNGVDGVRTASSAFGYSAGAGGTVTQATNKSTAVTLHKLCGQITMMNSALAAGAIVVFTLTNNQIATGDKLILNHDGAGTFGPYLLNARCAAGSAQIAVRNTSAASLSEAIVIGFAVVKAITA